MAHHVLNARDVGLGKELLAAILHVEGAAVQPDRVAAQQLEEPPRRAGELRGDIGEA